MGQVLPSPVQQTAIPATQEVAPVEVTHWSARLVDEACERDYQFSRLADDRRRFQLVLVFVGLAAGLNVAGDFLAVRSGIDLGWGPLPQVGFLAAAFVAAVLSLRVASPQSLERLTIVFITVGIVATLASLCLHPRLGVIWPTMMLGALIVIYFCLPLRFTTILVLAACYSLVAPLTWTISVAQTPTLDDMYRTGLRLVLANVLGFTVANRLQRSQRVQFAQNRLLQKLLSTDALTGIANRRHFDHMLREEWRRCARNGEPLSLLMIDVDYFKEYNDRLGHLQGDDCLRRIAILFTQAGRRAGDLVARYGGEEFVCLLPNADTAGAMSVAMRLQELIDQACIAHPASQRGPFLTISIGAATAKPPAETPQALVELADRLLYAAKKNGRGGIAGAEIGAAAEVVFVPAHDEGTVGQTRVA